VGREGIEPTLLIEERLFYRQLGLPSPIDPLLGWRPEARGWSEIPTASGLKPLASLVTQAGFEPAIAKV
jgi:hypothetical protein